MKNKNLKFLEQAINDLGELEVLIAQHSHYDGIASKETQFEWVNKLIPITSKLDKIWKDESALDN
jgi:hypothetical protein